MTEQPDNLGLEHLRAIRADMATMREDQLDMKRRINDLSQHVIALRRDVMTFGETVAHVEGRLDRYGERLIRIERRLQIVDEPSS